MKVDQLIEQKGSWLAPDGEAGVVVSSRVRLARNLKDEFFPNWAGGETRDRLCRDLIAILGGLDPLGAPLITGMEQLTALDKQILFERRLISREHMAKGKGSGLAIRPDEALAVMVNEEDHLRIQAIQPGLHLAECLAMTFDLDSALERHVTYAFDDRLGYLTACPSNVGTGLRASVMLHLPGLVLMEEINPVVKGLGKIGLAVRGIWGEGTEAIGDLFQISNQGTLGESEDQIRERLETIISEIVEQEQNARQRLLETRPERIRDHVGRSAGILANAHILPSREALQWISGLRLGIDLGIVPQIEIGIVNELLALIQPGHLQKLAHQELSSHERDVMRARLIRDKLANPQDPSTHR